MGSLSGRRSSRSSLSREDYSTKTSVRHLADEIVGPLNRKQVQPESSLSISEYIEKYYFPAVEKELRPSTFKGYKDFIYETHLKSRLRDLRFRISGPFTGRDYFGKYRASGTGHCCISNYFLATCSNSQDRKAHQMG
jgi:hypothetical protein